VYPNINIVGISDSRKGWGLNDHLLVRNLDPRLPALQQCLQHLEVVAEHLAVVMVDVLHQEVNQTGGQRLLFCCVLDERQDSEFKTNSKPLVFLTSQG